MSRLSRIILLCLCVAGIFLAAKRVWRVQFAKQYLSQLKTSEESVQPILSEAVVRSANEFEPFESLEGAFVHDVASRLQQSLAARPGEEAMQGYCSVLSLYGSALRSAPYSSSYLMDWANVRQLLAGQQCSEAFTEGSYRAALEFAIQSAPLDPETRFNAGLLYLWDGARQPALEQFNKFLDYTTEISEVQEEYIVSAVHDATELLAVVPARFPHVVRWASIFKSRRSREFNIFRPAFATLQRRAVESLVTAYHAGNVQESVFRNHLISLSEHTATDTLRRLVDATIAAYLGGMMRKELSEYFEFRSSLDGLGRVVAWQARDRRPDTSSLAIWGRDDLVTFDSRGVTIGFFLASNQRIRLIELQGVDGGQPPQPEDVRLFVSSDNSTWEEVAMGGRARSFVVHGRPVLGISVTNGTAPFWKIHFASPGEGQFSNYLDRLVRVYGISGRKRKRS